ncbi:MAG: cobaltochelatase subunit CobN [Granulosicoccus sp.]|nr:cobaltochelatase subunit CobN [Granulosicoccus sp.]
MHLLAARPGGFVDDEGIIDLQQSPGDIVVLSAQDTSLGLLASVAETLPKDFPSIRLANTIHLNKPAAFDLYASQVIEHARLVIVALLGGRSYWEYGVERLVELAERREFALVLVPGDDQVDESLADLSNCSSDKCYRIWQYLRFGGWRNSEHFYAYLQQQFFDGTTLDCLPPKALPPCVLYDRKKGETTIGEWLEQSQVGTPSALLIFYRSHLQSGNTRAFDQFIEMLESNFNVLAVATLSLKELSCLETINLLLEQAQCQVVINTTSFSQHVEGNAALSSSPQLVQNTLFHRNIPVIQAILAASNRQDWEDNSQGLRARDIAMNVALPEFDGRIISRAISFKELDARSERTQHDVIRYQLHVDRAGFVRDLALGWSTLSTKPNADKRIGLILANYPTKDGRIGNGVGMDTPESTVHILTALQQAGYLCDALPENGGALIQRLLEGATNDLDTLSLKPAEQSLDMESYQRLFNALPESTQSAVTARWGAPESDPKCRENRLIVSGIRSGNLFVGIQPARGFNVDVVANYHDPDLVPPHGYLAFYFWLRHVFQIDAVVHIGKHGNLEWLPGKSVGLSEKCWPDIALGPLPHLYPFIVNDPGEGAQAKRRAQAVIVDHLMPPMARANSYGPMAELERLVDELYLAAGLDAAREKLLKQEIMTLLEHSHLDAEIGVDRSAAPEELFAEIDTYLCDLKEAQIRHGLHTLGMIGSEDKLAETLLALTKLPRGEQESDSGFLHAICEDLILRNGPDIFNPLDFEAARSWEGETPELLLSANSQPWRNEADARDKLEALGLSLIQELLNTDKIKTTLPRTGKLLRYIQNTILPALHQSAENEIHSVVSALEGQFVAAGPSGAPTRGRLDVLPTGRNFYSLDTRSIPTQTAWTLGERSAEQLILRHLQEHGEYPTQIGLSVWGTATMRTGGDDIAQGLALMGVRPVWAQGSNRVVDIEVIPGFQLGRPRVDVTLRISGFFRDAFPNVAKLFDRAAQTLADLEEPGDSNSIRKHITADTESKIKNGMDPEQATAEARFRVFGSKPGSYGAGLQGLIDERVWNNKADLAKAYVNWGGYSYSQENFGQPAFQAFEQRLGQIKAVVQNQDNREHDLLDSDDYYQFQGGMANAAEVLSGVQPATYHGDHSNPGKPIIRTLKEELNRVVRSRVLNPKWIKAMREHGYKGAFEMAATVDYLFAYDATTDLIADYQYEAVTDALINDSENRQFLEKANPNALKEMVERLIEAQQRNMWSQPGEYKNQLTDTLIEIENQLETME